MKKTYFQATNVKTVKSGPNQSDLLCEFTTALKHILKLNRRSISPSTSHKGDGNIPILNIAIVNFLIKFIVVVCFSTKWCQ